MRLRPGLCCLLVALILIGCARSTRESPADGVFVAGGEPAVEGASQRIHTVRSGDTLYSIAWRYELDIRDLIDWNSLDNPNLILVGQSLFLEPIRTAASPATAAEGKPLEDAVIVVEKLPESAAPAGRSRQEDVLAMRTPVPPPSDSPWIWPVRGPLVSSFGAAGETGRGIGIGGDIGADIRASAPGDVVYAGRGLAAYGNLIILKHDETLLSAYGHNDELLVSEGETVAQGQPIATMGMGPQRIPQVHFEIRRDGAPVNPLGYLPDAPETR